MDELVDDFAARRPSGLEQAYALWSRLLFSVARHVIADSGQAEDCVHDALVRVWRSPSRFTGNREMLKAYLIACVRNESLGMVRREGRRDARELKSVRLAPVSTSDPPLVDPVESQRLQDALGRLPDEQRTALTLAYYGNKTHVEIAQELNVPLGTIKSRISMAMRKLQAELANTEGGRS
ncbi:MAG: RNA polymerase sigma factor [Candidatus Cybelea sp.]